MNYWIFWHGSRIDLVEIPEHNNHSTSRYDGNRDDIPALRGDKNMFDSIVDPPRIQHMYRSLMLMVLSCILALLNSLLPLIPSLPFQIAGFVLQIVERVAVLVAVVSFLSHVYVSCSCHL